MGRAYARNSFHSHRVLRICCCAETDHQNLWHLGKHRSICYQLQVRTWTGDGLSHHLVAKNVLVSTPTFSQRPEKCSYLLSLSLLYSPVLFKTRNPEFPLLAHGVVCPLLSSTHGHLPRLHAPLTHAPFSSHTLKQSYDYTGFNSCRI